MVIFFDVRLSFVHKLFLLNRCLKIYKVLKYVKIHLHKTNRRKGHFRMALTYMKGLDDLEPWPIPIVHPNDQTEHSQRHVLCAEEMF